MNVTENTAEKATKKTDVKVNRNEAEKALQNVAEKQRRKTTQKELITSTRIMLNQLLPVKAVKTLDDAIAVYRVGEKLNGRANFACAKIIAKIKKRIIDLMNSE